MTKSTRPELLENPGQSVVGEADVAKHHFERPVASLTPEAEHGNLLISGTAAYGEAQSAFAQRARKAHLLHHPSIMLGGNGDPFAFGVLDSDYSSLFEYLRMVLIGFLVKAQRNAFHRLYILLPIVIIYFKR